MDTIVKTDSRDSAYSAAKDLKLAAVEVCEKLHTLEQIVGPASPHPSGAPKYKLFPLLLNHHLQRIEFLVNYIRQQLEINSGGE